MVAKVSGLELGRISSRPHGPGWARVITGLHLADCDEKVNFDGEMWGDRSQI
jgi:hypothetical protein